MSVLVGNPFFLGAGASAGGGVIQIERSLRFNSNDSAYLSRTPASEGNRKTWTWAGWVKRSAGSYVPLLFARDPSLSGWQYFFLATINADKILIETGSQVVLNTQALYRDFSAWMHIVFAVDATQATAANRLKLYVNGLEVTAFSTDGRSNITQNVDGYINSTNAHRIGSSYSDTRFADGYLADIHFIDGQALTPSSFGQFDANGEWQPKAYTGSYGTNGFRLDFSNNSAATATTLGKDQAGSNNWTPNNFSVTAGVGNDSLVDTPTSYGTDTGAGGEARGNYATFNPVAAGLGFLSNGNLDVDPTGSHGTRNATIGVSSGKWYAEFNLPTAAVCGLGITSLNNAYATWPDNTAGNYWFYFDGGTKYFYPGGGTQATSGGAPATGIWKIALDLDSGKCWLGTGSIWYDSAWNQTGNPTTGANPTFSSLPAATYFMFVETQVGASWQANFGQRPWGQTCPSGFKALCDTNLPAPVVAKPSEVMDAKLYTGNGSTQTISGLGFSPDLVWIKERSSTSSHQLYDTIRGATKTLYSNSSNEEQTNANALTSFTSTGFNVGVDNNVNQDTQTYVAWTWDAGSSTVTNTQGSITSQVRANASAGFSIVTYTGTGANATVGHGLGAAPSMVIVKRRNTTGDWQVRHTSIVAASSIQLNLTNAAASATTVWNITAPSSTVFSVGTDATVNASGGTYVAYCFAPVAGYTSSLSYTGNGSTEGVLVYLGLRAKLLLIKRTDTTGNWYLWDTVRNTYNVVGEELYPNLSNAETNAIDLDILSNGFKMRSGAADFNASGGTYVGFAWAEAPFVYSRAR